MHPLSSSSRLRFGFRFVLLARQWRRALDERMAVLGLSDATWAPLVHLEAAGNGISQKDLAARLGIDGSSLVRLLDLLAGRGLVERRTSATDRRARQLHLTEAGRAAVKQIRAVLAEAEAEFLADLGDAEIEAMLDAFDRIGHRLQRPRLATEQPA